MGLYSGWLIIGGIFVSEIWGLFFGGDYHRKFTVYFPFAARVPQKA